MTENIVTCEDHYIIDGVEFYFYSDDETDGYILNEPLKAANIKELYIPNSVNGIEIKEIEFCNGYLRGFDTIKVCENNRNFTVIDNVLFTKYMESLIIYPPEKKDEIYCVPAGVKYIEQDAFCDNKYLKTLYLPTGLEMIRTYSMTENLETIYIPRTLKWVAHKAFVGCKSLKTVFYEGTAEEWNLIDFTGFNSRLTNADIHFNANIEPV